MAFNATVWMSNRIGNGKSSKYLSTFLAFVGTFHQIQSLTPLYCPALASASARASTFPHLSVSSLLPLGETVAPIRRCRRRCSAVVPGPCSLPRTSADTCPRGLHLAHRLGHRLGARGLAALPPLPDLGAGVSLPGDEEGAAPAPRGLPPQPHLEVDADDICRFTTTHTTTATKVGVHELRHCVVRRFIEVNDVMGEDDIGFV